MLLFFSLFKKTLLTQNYLRFKGNILALARAGLIMVVGLWALVFFFFENFQLFFLVLYLRPRFYCGIFVLSSRRRGMRGNQVKLCFPWGVDGSEKRVNMGCDRAGNWARCSPKLFRVS